MPSSPPARRLALLGLLTALLTGASASSTLTSSQAPPGRVVLISLDGMGTRLFLDDPVSDELRTLRALRARGVMADGLIPHMPSTTANTHAALWTGAWGDTNGITGNDMPLPPRGERLASATVSGYRSDGLRAEPLWVAAARQGVSTVAQQATQVFPLRDDLTGAAMVAPPVVLHGYQAPVVAPSRWLGPADVTRRRCASGDRAVRCFSWVAGPVTFRAALRRGPHQASALRVHLDGTTRAVDVPLVPTEHEPPRGRSLARHFSDGLLVDVPGVPPVMAYFRLFEASADGRSLVLFQSQLQESVLSRGRVVSRAESIALLEATGGFVGNGDDEPWEREGVGGLALWQGGDGRRERRYLETLELGIRQTIRQAQHLWHTHAPRFFLGYVSMPDEMDHAWIGHARDDARYEPLRRWGYQLVDRAVETYAGFVSDRDHLVFVSDHGMAPVTHEVRVNLALRAAGLVTVDARGRIDPARSQVIFGRNCLRIHTDDWKGGLVPVGQREAVLARAVTVLRGIRAEGDARPVITDAFWTPADRERLGFGGPNGHDACFDARPGFMMATTMGDGPLVRRRPRPTGEHGYLPTRPDMHGILIAAGPGLPAGGRWPVTRAIDVAPLVSDLLGIHPPHSATGQSPLPQ